MQKEHINKISKYEPSDFKQFRLNSYEMFKSSFNPIYGPTIKEDFDKYSEEELIKFLSEDGMLLKRPILVSNDNVILGFSEKLYGDL